MPEFEYGDARLPRRFWIKVYPCIDSEHWLWMAYLRPDGYGAFGVGSRRDGTDRIVRAHRLAYETLVGPVPKGMDLDHLCRIRRCVNPGCLEPVTRHENIVRGDGPRESRQRQIVKTHCPAGHPYDEDNTYIAPPTGARQCRECRRERNARWRARHRPDG